MNPMEAARAAYRRNPEQYVNYLIGVRAIVELYVKADADGELPGRNWYAELLFIVPERRNVATPEGSVETWYDRQTRNWITQHKDAQGFQIGDARIAGEKLGAALNHAAALRELFSL